MAVGKESSIMLAHLPTTLANILKARGTDGHTNMGAGCLTHSSHMVLQLQVAKERARIILYASEEVQSLETHGGTSSASVCLIPSLQQ